MGRRLGILGGSFDPVHNGHLLLATSAIEGGALDRLIVVPARLSPFKTESEPAPDESRLAMLELAFDGLSAVEIDDLELRRGGVSYTIDSLRVLAARHPGDELFLILGADALEGLPRWREARALVGLAGLLVAERPGSRMPDPAVLERELPGIRIEVFSMPRVDLSSREIRARIREGRPLHGHLPPAVAAFVARQGLYGGPDPGASSPPPG